MIEVPTEECYRGLHLLIGKLFVAAIRGTLTHQPLWGLCPHHIQMEHMAMEFRKNSPRETEAGIGNKLQPGQWFGSQSNMGISFVNLTHPVQNSWVTHTH